MRERMGRFVAEYVLCGDAKQSALAAGYSPEYARSQAYKLLKHPSVVAALESGVVPEEWAPCLVTNQRAKEILSAIVLATPEMFVNEYGQVDVEVGGVFKHALREMVMTEDASGRPVAKVRLFDKVRALRELRKWNDEDAARAAKLAEFAWAVRREHGAVEDTDLSLEPGSEVGTVDGASMTGERESMSRTVEEEIGPEVTVFVETGSGPMRLASEDVELLDSGVLAASLQRSEEVAPGGIEVRDGAAEPTDKTTDIDSEIELGCVVGDKEIIGREAQSEAVVESLPRGRVMSDVELRFLSKEERERMDANRPLRLKERERIQSELFLKRQAEKVARRAQADR